MPGASSRRFVYELLDRSALASPPECDSVLMLLQ